MPDRATRLERTPRRVLFTVFVLLGTLAASPVAASTGTTATSSDGTTSGAPETTAPDPTGTSEPETTDSEATTSVIETPSEELVGSEPDTDRGDVALIAVVGLVLVLSLAAWWMVRRDDERPVADREPPPTDLI